MFFTLRSLAKNIESLEWFVAQFSAKPHIIMVSETWLNAHLSQSYEIKDYRFEHSAQIEWRGKGAGIFIHNSLQYNRRLDLESNICEFQSIFIELKNVDDRPMILGSVYRSPSYPALPFIEYLESMLNTINIEHKLSLIGGDITIDLLKHNL